MLKITFFDVDHGNAIHVQTPNNKHFMFDLGVGSYSSGKEFSPLRYLRNRGINQLDGVIITHPHTDHIDDIGNFDAFSPKVLWRPTHLTRAVY